ncbi:MAG: hypothetical protein RLZZ141_537 [Pseudomonadota bacterium]
MVHDRRIRNLEGLKATGDSSRVLNLVSVWSQSGHLPEYSEQPLFENRRLNRALILKHRLRNNEQDLFDSPHYVGTKILLPIDDRDWKLGGRFVFIGQRDYLTVLSNTFGQSIVNSQRDRDILDILASSPSLDPFLLKEILVKNSVVVSSCYFEISKPDAHAMNSFLKQEISKLVAHISLGGDNINAYTEKLANKIMSGRIDDGLEHLRVALNLPVEDFEDGIFSWRGFLYYKWSQINLSRKMLPVMDSIMSLKPVGLVSDHKKKKIRNSKMELNRIIQNTIKDVLGTLSIYDESYKSLVIGSNPVIFRDFLITAPSLFLKLGSQLGMMNYICNFWNFRCDPKQSVSAMDADELTELLAEFHEGLVFDKKVPEGAW